MVIKKIILLYFLFNLFNVNAQNEVIIQPKEYPGALRNPLKGFTTRGIYDHPWAATAQTYIQWNEIENSESDGIEKIKKFCDEKWAGVEDKNVKVIPRVYLHWSCIGAVTENSGRRICKTMITQVNSFRKGYFV